MIEIDLTVISFHKQVQFWGEVTAEGSDPVWDADLRFAITSEALLVGVAEGDIEFDVSIKIGEFPEKPTDVYGSAVIVIGDDGLEIANVVSSTVELKSGYIGSYLDIPWSGSTRIDLVAKGCLRYRESGISYPQELIAYVNPG